MLYIMFNSNVVSILKTISHYDMALQISPVYTISYTISDTISHIISHTAM